MIHRQRHLHRLHSLQIASLQRGGSDQRRRRSVTDRLVHPKNTAVTSFFWRETAELSGRLNGITGMHTPETHPWMKAVGVHGRRLSQGQTEICRSCRAGQQPTHITPSQVGVGFQHQCHNPRDHGCGGRRAPCKWRVVRVVWPGARSQSTWARNVGGPDVCHAVRAAQQTHGRGTEQNIGTGFGIGRRTTPVIHGAHSQHTRVVGIGISVAVFVGATIARSEHHHRAFASASLSHCRSHGFLPCRIRTDIAAFATLGVKRAPAVVDDVGPQLDGRTQGRSYQAGRNAVIRQKFGFGCDTTTAQAVVGTGHGNTDHGRAVGVVPLSRVGVLRCTGCCPWR